MAVRAGAADGIRQRNLSAVLRLIHREGPTPRSRLTAITGLNRSTVAALVSELVELGLAQERAPEETNRVGRPSPVVSVSPAVAAIAVNPEVDAVTIAAVGLGSRVIVRERVDRETVVSPEQTADLARAAIARWQARELAGTRLVGVGLAVPGLVRADDGLVRFAPHLQWRDAPVRDLVHEATGLPTAIGNDASLGAIAEHSFGAGRGIADLVYLNGGASGIGGGLVVGGSAVGGSGGYAGEFGQNRPGIEAPEDRRVSGGVLEDEVSRAWLLDAVGLRSADEPTLAQAIAGSTAPGVVLEVARQRRILATALANAVNVLNPSVVILGGFLATLAEQDLDGLLAAVVEQAMPAATEDLELRPAALGEDRLMIGAAEAAFAAVLEDPLLLA